MTKEEAIICLKGIKNYGRDTFNEQSDWQDCLDMAIQALEQEPKTGEWISDVDYWGDIVTTVNGYTCSECGVFNADDDNFCPNCGADMGEGKDED